MKSKIEQETHLPGTTAPEIASNKSERRNRSKSRSNTLGLETSLFKEGEVSNNEANLLSKETFSEIAALNDQASKRKKQRSPSPSKKGKDILTKKSQQQDFTRNDVELSESKKSFKKEKRRAKASEKIQWDLKTSQEKQYTASQASNGSANIYKMYRQSTNRSPYSPYELGGNQREQQQQQQQQSSTQSTPNSAYFNQYPYSNYFDDDLFKETLSMHDARENDDYEEVLEEDNSKSKQVRKKSVSEAMKGARLASLMGVRGQSEIDTTRKENDLQRVEQRQSERASPKQGQIRERRMNDETQNKHHFTLEPYHPFNYKSEDEDEKPSPFHASRSSSILANKNGILKVLL